jgi:hypothetical protein
MIEDLQNLKGNVLALAGTAVLVGIFVGSLIAGSLKRRWRRLEKERSQRIAEEQERHERRRADLHRFHIQKLRDAGLDDDALRRLGIPGFESPDDVKAN